MLPETGNYVELYKTGELKRILDSVVSNLENCRLCPRMCGVNRKEEKGACLQSDKPMFTNAVVHTGEEPPLITGTGAGTVFFHRLPHEMRLLPELRLLATEQRDRIFSGTARRYFSRTPE